MIGEEKAVQAIYDAAYRDSARPEVRAWATTHSDAEDPVDVARELIRVFCANHPYMPSPIAQETIRSPAQVLVDSQGYVDADDACAVFACALMSLDIRVAIVGQAIQLPAIHHAIVSVYQRGLWYDFDPMYGKEPEEVLKATREVRVFEPSRGLVRR